MENITIVNILIWVSFVLINGFVVSYFSKRGENLATKKDIKIITEKVEEVKVKFTSEMEKYKKDLRVEERFKIERLLSERNAILDFGSELLTFIHDLTIYDNQEYINEKEYVNIRYKQIKKKSYKSLLDLSKLELIINDPKLLDVFQSLFKSVNSNLITLNIRMLEDMTELHIEWERRQIDTEEETNEWEGRRETLINNFTNQIKEKLKIIEPKIKNMKAITIQKLKEYVLIENA